MDHVYDLGTGETVPLPPGEFLEEAAESTQTKFLARNWNFQTKPAKRKLFLIQDRLKGKSFHRFVHNMDDVVDYIKLALDPTEWEVQRHDFAALPFLEQMRLASKARITFGAHGDGLAWGLFMPPRSVVMEAVPVRRGGYQVCSEGLNKNKRGIFGGVMRFADEVGHICWYNAVGRGKGEATSGANTTATVATSGGQIESDVYDWNWRMLDIEMDLGKVAYWLRHALWFVGQGLKEGEYERCQEGLARLYEIRGWPM